MRAFSIYAFDKTCGDKPSRGRKDKTCGVCPEKHLPGPAFDRRLQEITEQHSPKKLPNNRFAIMRNSDDTEKGITV